MAAENIGWRLENVVYIELLRKCANEFLDVYYYKPGPKDREVDFVVCEKSRALELIQVAYDIDSPPRPSSVRHLLSSQPRTLSSAKILLWSLLQRPGMWK